MAITIKDSSGVVRNIKATLDGSDYVIHKNVDTLAAGDNVIGQVKITDGTEVASVNASNQLVVAVAAALPAGTNAIGKLAANSGVDIGDVDIKSIAAGDNNIGNVDIVTVPAPLSTTGGGTEAAALRVTLASDSTGLVSVDDNGGSLTVDVGTALPAGDNNIGNVDIVSLPASTNTIEVVGDAAHGSAVAGNPVRVGGRANNADVTAEANGDTVDMICDLTGKQVISLHAPYSLFLSGVTADITDTTATSVIAAQGAEFRVYVTSLLVTNSDADTGTVVKLTDGSGGSTLWRGYAAAGGGGFAQTFTVPIFTTANTALYVECETSGATVQVSAAGYKGR